MMTNPETHAAYVKLAEHRQHVLGATDMRLRDFRESWLPQVLNSTELAPLANVPTSYLVSLYPRLYVQGPHAEQLSRIVMQVATMLADDQVPDEDKRRFAAELWSTYHNRWSELEDEGEWDALRLAVDEIGLGDAIIYNTTIVRPDAEYLTDLLLPYVYAEATKGNRFFNAVTGFTQMILIYGLVPIDTLLCDRFFDDDGNEWDYEHAMETEEELNCYTEGLHTARKFFQQHEAFMEDWGLS